MTPITFFEKCFYLQRTLHTGLAVILQQSLEIMFSPEELQHLQQEPLYRATKALVKDLDKQTEHPGVHYHNTRHFGDVMLASALLSRFEPQLSFIEKLELLAAMVAHDLGHDGTINTEFNNLEKNSVELFSVYLHAANVSKSQTARVGRVILSTDPLKEEKNRLAYSTAKNGSYRFGKRDAVLAALAHDADLFGSILPKTGGHLSHALAQEWSNISHPAAKTITTFRGREKFLTGAAPISDAAVNAGLEGARLGQLAALASLTPQYLDSIDYASAESAFLTATENSGYLKTEPSLNLECPS